LDVNVDNLQNKIEEVHDALEQELEEGLATKVDASMFDSIVQSANTALGQLQTKASTLEQEIDSVETAVENLEIDLNTLNTEVE
jgi:predicted nuclease with TOPRIM domain